MNKVFSIGFVCRDWQNHEVFKNPRKLIPMKINESTALSLFFTAIYLINLWFIHNIFGSLCISEGTDGFIVTNTGWGDSWKKDDN